MSLRLVTLGGLQLFQNGKDTNLAVQRRSRVALLTYLTVEREVTRDQAKSVFWPESDEEKARHSLSQALYELRQSLGDAWLQVNGDRLHVCDVELDAHSFETAVTAGAHERALQYYEGPFLGQVDNLPDSKPFEYWVDEQRAHLERLHRKARRAHIESAVAQGDFAGAVTSAREWVRLNPLEDEAQHRLIELLATTGHPTEAVRQYEVYARLLENDGLQPLDETRAIVASIKRADLVSRPAPRTADALPATALRNAGLSIDLEVIRPLGEGSVAQVFLARDIALKRLVSVKVLRPELAADDIARDRFEREAQAAASISHPNVMAVHRVGHRADGVPYIVMEYIEGRTLSDLLIAKGAFSVADTRHVMLSVARALSELHDNDTVHRDIRPNNVMWEDEDARILLMDFGFAAEVDSGSQEPMRVGETVGDALHMSPEQRRGEPVTEQSDSYCLGVLAYELLTGGVPAENSPPLMVARPDVDRRLSDLVGRCLAPIPQHRPTASDIVEALTSQPAQQPAQPLLARLQGALHRLLGSS